MESFHGLRKRRARRGLPQQVRVGTEGSIAPPPRRSHCTSSHISLIRVPTIQLFSSALHMTSYHSVSRHCDFVALSLFCFFLGAMQVEQSYQTLRRLAARLIELQEGNASTYIVSGVNHLPLSLSESLLPSDLSAESTAGGLLVDFYNRVTECDCRIRDCTAVLRGFKEIMVCSMQVFLHCQSYSIRTAF